MVNFGLNSASLLGIILAVAGAGLYFLRSVRPELSRDQDIAFTAIGIICGFILIFQGWRLDPILQFGQLLLSGSTIFFAYENIKLRGIATEQAKEKSKIVDDRPVSRRYKAEIEDREFLDDRPRNSRRIRGDSERRSYDRVEDESDTQPRRRATARQLPEDRFAAEETPRRRRRDDSDSSRKLARRTVDTWDNDDDWNEPDEAPVRVRRALPDAAGVAARNDNLASNPSPRRSTRRTSERPMEDRDWNEDLSASSSNREFNDLEDVETTPRRRRNRSTDSAENSNRDRQQLMADRNVPGAEGSTSDYVDYEPLNKPLDARIDPPSGLPPSGSEPIVFPDRY